MAKQSGGMPKIDEDFMKELISQGVPAKRESQPDDAPQPGGETETAHEGRQTETVRVEKPTPRKRKGGSGDYRETYFQKVELADRQPLYVSRTTHEKLMRIVTVIGGRQTNTGFLIQPHSIPAVYKFLRPVFIMIIHQFRNTVRRFFHYLFYRHFP